jgi:hypothetical protein
VASLDWQPAPGNPFLQELRAGLLAASGYLFDVTEGQMAFGELTLHTDGRSWQGADLRFLRANDYRPTAYVGGIVPEPIQYGPASGTIYKPGRRITAVTGTVTTPSAAPGTGLTATAPSSTSGPTTRSSSTMNTSTAPGASRSAPTPA